MKEYKVVMLKLGITRRSEKLEDTLNQYAREGWQLSSIAQGWVSMILERDKNR